MADNVAPVRSSERLRKRKAEVADAEVVPVEQITPNDVPVTPPKPKSKKAKRITKPAPPKAPLGEVQNTGFTKKKPAPKSNAGGVKAKGGAPTKRR